MSSVNPYALERRNAAAFSKKSRSCIRDGIQMLHHRNTSGDRLRLVHVHG